VSSNFNAIRNDLINSGIEKSRLSSGSVDEKTLVLEDMVWNTIRKELGLRQQRIPVWIPAIEKYLSGGILDEVLQDKKLDRILSDLSYQGYDMDGVLKNTLEEAKLDEFEEFQIHIL
jgi:hypothetical protein